jgi:hypothetical protein
MRVPTSAGHVYQYHTSISREKYSNLFGSWSSMLLSKDFGPGFLFLALSWDHEPGPTK